MAGFPSTRALVDRVLSELGDALREHTAATSLAAKLRTMTRVQDARWRVLTLATLIYPEGSPQPRRAGVAAALYEYAITSRAGEERARWADVEAIIDQIAALYPPKGEA